MKRSRLISGARVAAAAFVMSGAGLLVAEGTAGSAAAATPHDAIDSPNVSAMDFGSVSVGSVSGIQDLKITNTGTTPDLICNVALAGADPDDFGTLLPVTPDQTCPDGSDGLLLQPSDTADIGVFFFPGALGPRSATATIEDSSTNPPTITLTGMGTEGYYLTTSGGKVSTFGDAVNQGDTSKLHLNSPIASMASTGTGGGYWLVAGDGGIFNYGDAGFFGSAGGLPLNKPIVGMASTFDGGGYWLVASDGGIFDYGDAGFFGSTGSLHLNKPIVGMAPTPDGGGYWLVASDGGIFSYGDAGFYGSTGSLHLNAPIVGMAPTPDGGGYWLVASDGGIFAYGDATFYGSTGGIHLSKPIVGMAATPDGRGYWFVASDGGIFDYGDAPFYGSTGGTGASDTVAMASTGAPTLQAALDAPALRTRVLHELERVRATGNDRLLMG